jgi:hypothetical protein
MNDSSTETPEIMPCGHPRACLVSADVEHDSTVNCAWCADKARWEGLLKEYHILVYEQELEIDELKTAAQFDAAMLAQQCDLAREAETALARERMRATVGGGSVL